MLGAEQEHNTIQPNCIVLLFGAIQNFRVVRCQGDAQYKILGLFSAEPEHRTTPTPSKVDTAGTRDLAKCMTETLQQGPAASSVTDFACRVGFAPVTDFACGV